jgi:aminoglycoside 2'-N-acetyltransferase I
MADLRLAHTSQLDRATLGAIRSLLFAAFDGEFAESDFEHSLGGMHALVGDEGGLVGHASVVQRRLVYADRALRVGYVEGVAVRADRRREGHAAAMMTQIEGVIRGAYDLGALGSSELAVPFYSGRGWQQWQGQTFALTPDGVVRTADEDDGVYVLPVDVPVDLTADLTCDWRDGDVW